jgi:hypothetical protein
MDEFERMLLCKPVPQHFENREESQIKISGCPISGAEQTGYLLNTKDEC